MLLDGFKLNSTALVIRECQHSKTTNHIFTNGNEYRSADLVSISRIKFNLNTLIRYGDETRGLTWSGSNQCLLHVIALPTH